MDLAANLTLYTSTSLNDALRLPPGIAAAFFDGKPFSDWKQARETELKIQVGIADRLNSVIRACGIVAKTVAKTR